MKCLLKIRKLVSVKSPWPFLPFIFHLCVDFTWFFILLGDVDDKVLDALRRFLLRSLKCFQAFCICIAVTSVMFPIIIIAAEVEKN